MNRHCEPEGRKKCESEAICKLKGVFPYKRRLLRSFTQPYAWARNDVVSIPLISLLSLFLHISLIPLFFLLTLSSHATIHTVKQDGTGDFTTIQPGINAAATGDTVLVWPGIYFENIDYNNKSITVASLYLTTQDESYIYSTIIDGNMNGSSVLIKDCDAITVICGFTIQHGSGDLTVQSGGGINIQFAVDVEVNYNRIINNNSRSGGGIFIRYSDVILKGNSICFNNAYWAGGGVGQSNFSEIEFSATEKNSIYMNYAAFGNDYIKSYDIGPVNFIVDTFTVVEPDEHFIYSPDTWGNPQYDITIQMDHHFLDQENADLYVDPSGDDFNTGLSFDDPLKTISFALQKIKTDSSNHRTIFLQEGIYSSESNDEFLPINPRSYLSIKGVSSENTIIDGQNEISFMYSNASIKHLTIKNISFINGFGNINDFPGCSGIEINSNSYFILDSSNFYNCIGAIGVINIMNPFETILRHINTYNSIGGLSIGSNVAEDLSFKLLNSNVNNIMPAANPNYGIGGGIAIIGTQSGSSNLNGFLFNNLFDNNICHPDPFWGDGGGSGIYLINPSLINIINCTFSENEMEEFDGGTVFTFDGPQVSFYNNIFYNNSPRNFYLDQSNNPDYPAIVNVSYNNIEGGEENVYNKNNYNTFNWLEGNMDEDPLWVGGGEPFNYELQPESTCINAGVPKFEAGMDYPYIKEEDGKYILYMLEGDTVTLPVTDLAGNPRISGGRIDMGAYEWQDTTTKIQNSKYQNPNLKMQVYPNPFMSNTFISFSTSNEYLVTLEVIDMKGKRVRYIADNHFPAGDYKLVWDGNNDSGFEINLGTYFICFYLDRKLVQTIKIIKSSQ